MDFIKLRHTRINVSHIVNYFPCGASGIRVYTIRENPCEAYYDNDDERDVELENIDRLLVLVKAKNRGSILKE